MLKTFSITDIGNVRKVNQDFVYTSEMPVGPLPNLFLLADGMGGHRAGDFASKATVETMVEKIESSEHTEPVRVFREAISAANALIYEKATTEMAMEGMGTTIVAACCVGDELQIANIGDSRLYIINDKITQITKDHSLVEEMVRIGNIDRSEARNHPDKNIITRAVGVGDTVEADYFTVDMQEGDCILMCSDGLSNMVEDEQIRMLLESGRDIVDKVQKLVEAAKKNGGLDNISVILVEPYA